jgi:subtilase family serine protease
MRTLAGLLTLTGIAAALSLTLTSTAGATPASATTTVHTCEQNTAPGTAHCMAIQRTTTGSARPDVAGGAAPAGLSPADLRSAYNLTAARGGAGATVAIIDAADDPYVEADLAKYRSQFGLPACTTANGCFKKVNQNGATAPLPAGDIGWAAEISLDVDMVSAICPNCHILLVEASSGNFPDLGAAVNTAVRLGAKFVSNSYGGSEYAGETSTDAFYRHPGVAITASTGDSGYGMSYPAASPYVTAVGGTTLTPAGNARGWSETAWSQAGSGCSAYEAKPAFQSALATGCARRADADVSAVADPATGVAGYDTYGSDGWAVYGGTSAAAPIIASVYALAGNPGATDQPAAYPGTHASKLNDITSGANGACSPALQCHAGPGWDGPTGLGTPNGTAAFTR